MYQDERIPNWAFNKRRDYSIILSTMLLGIAAVFQYIWANLPTLFFLCLVTIIWLLTMYFFQDPDRVVVNKPGLVVGPCDGTVKEITSVKENRFLNEESTRISIFLSVFNIHLQRFPLEHLVDLIHRVTMQAAANYYEVKR